MLVGSLLVISWATITMMTFYIFRGDVGTSIFTVLTALTLYLGGYYFWIAIYMFIDMSLTFTRANIVSPSLALRRRSSCVCPT